MSNTTLLQIVGAYKSYGIKNLFMDASFAVNEGEHIGLIGPNGAGKTTLFKVIANQEDLDSGEIIRSKRLRLGYLEQEAAWDTAETIEQMLIKESIMPLWDLKKQGRILGFSEEDYQRPLASLSGGYRMRAKLLSLIGQEPNLLLLDEPTNFLDLETVLVLERFLQGYQGAFLLISHDREFLRRVTDHTVEVEAGDVTKFPGQIDDYFEQKTMLREQLEKSAAQQSAKKQQILDFVSRFGAKATKARQAQSRLKALEKMEVIEVKPVPIRARIPIPPPVRTGKEVLRVEAVAYGYGSGPAWKDVDLVLERGDHLGIVGVNGAGKSTLLKLLGGMIPPQSGSIKEGMGVSKMLFSQHSADQLRPDETVLQALTRSTHSEVTQQEILNMAGALLFGGDAIDKPIRVLSGGEKARVALGQVLLSKVSLLLLDEPTNHLDFETVESLTMALAAYEGSLVVVSHDRGFIRRIANKILWIEKGKVQTWPGTYDDYVWSLQRGALAEQVAEESSAGSHVISAVSRMEGTPNRYQRQKQLDADIRKSEKEIFQLERDLKKLAEKRGQLTENLILATGLMVSQLSKELHEVGLLIDETEAHLLAQMERIENLQKERNAMRDKG